MAWETWCWVQVLIACLGLRPPESCAIQPQTSVLQITSWAAPCRLQFISRLYLHDLPWFPEWPPHPLTDLSHAFGNALVLAVWMVIQTTPKYLLWWFCGDTTERDPWQIGLTQTTRQGNYLGIWLSFIWRAICFSWRGRIWTGNRGRKEMSEACLSSQVLGLLAEWSAVARAAFTLQWHPNAWETSQQLWDWGEMKESPIAAK